MQFRLRSSRKLTSRFLSHKLFKKTDELIWIWRVRCETFQEDEKNWLIFILWDFYRNRLVRFWILLICPISWFCSQKVESHQSDRSTSQQIFQNYRLQLLHISWTAIFEKFKKKKSNPFIFLYFLLSLTPPPPTLLVLIPSSFPFSN